MFCMLDKRVAPKFNSLVSTGEKAEKMEIRGENKESNIYKQSRFLWSYQLAEMVLLFFSLAKVIAETPPSPH